MRHQEADRVPVMCQLTLGHYFVNMRQRWKSHEIWFTSEAFADALLTLRERYRFDGILINIPGRNPDLRDQIASIDDMGDEYHIHWKDGGLTILPTNDNPSYTPPGDTLYPNFLEFDPDRDIDRVHEWPKYIWGVYHTPYVPGTGPGMLLEAPDYFYRTIDMVRAAVGDTVSIHGEVFSPFTHFLELFGYQDALMALALDGGRAEAILERLAETTIAWGKAQARRGVDAVLISSAFAGGGFISRPMYNQFVVPYERAVADALHTEFPDLPVYTHTCGRLGDRLELLAESHVDGVDTLDPPPLGNVELTDAKARIGRRMFIKGNMNSVALLEDTEESQVVERARSALAAGMPGGGYILSTACSVAPHVAPWKLEMLVDVANEFGRYPEHRL